MKTSEKTNELCKAMCEFQSKLITLAKDTKAYNYKYTNLATIWESFRPLLGELGLFIFQDVVTTEEGVKVATRITHISDQWIETDYILIPMNKRDAHSTGSACTYGRRYSLSCALGIVCDEDDDGNRASQSAPVKKENKTVPIQPKKKECTQVQFKDFVDSWSKTYDKENIMEYIDSKSKAYDKTYLEIVYELIQDPEAFEKHFLYRLEKNNAPKHKEG